VVEGPDGFFEGCLPIRVLSKDNVYVGEREMGEGALDALEDVLAREAGVVGCAGGEGGAPAELQTGIIQVSGLLTRRMDGGKGKLPLSKSPNYFSSSHTF
jgi:hypothetical protein